jgi:hypothetical protein
MEWRSMEEFKIVPVESREEQTQQQATLLTDIPQTCSPTYPAAVPKAQGCSWQTPSRQGS